MITRIMKPKASIGILNEKHGPMHPHLGVRKAASLSFLSRGFQVLLGHCPYLEDFTS